jgi:hypothetical protein
MTHLVAHERLRSLHIAKLTCETHGAANCQACLDTRARLAEGQTVAPNDLDHAPQSNAPVICLVAVGIMALVVTSYSLATLLIEWVGG